VAETPYDDYAKGLAFQRSAWERKAALRIQYRHWYRMIVAALAPPEPVVEVGAGCGNFKAYHPSCVAVDVYRGGPWTERVMDAQALDLRAGEGGNSVAVDVLHHLQRPLEFLRRAEGALRPEGRLVVCEPAATPWARPVHGLAHHERLDLAWPLFALDGTPPEPDPGRTFASMALAEILFWREPSRTLSAVPRLRLVRRGSSASCSTRSRAASAIVVSSRHSDCPLCCEPRTSCSRPSRAGLRACAC
jgi:SAM-dependent methyltransferase